MEKLSNVEIIKGVLTNICNIIAKRTTQSFAVTLLETINRALESKFNFLRFIKFNTKDTSNEIISVSSDLNSIDSILLGRVVETIIQIICLDLKEKAGIYFIKEIINNSSENLVAELERAEIDLDLLKVQQSYIYNQQKRVKKIFESREETSDFNGKKSLLNYSWENVSNCIYDANNRICTIISKEGKVLDTLDLDKIVNQYLLELTEGNNISLPIDHELDNKEKHLKFKESKEV